MPGDSRVQGASPSAKAPVTVETDVVIIGAGICGILAARECHDRGYPYVILDREDQFGGVWNTMANNYSYLQVPLGPWAAGGGGGAQGGRPAAAPPARRWPAASSGSAHQPPRPPNPLPAGF